MKLSGNLFLEKNYMKGNLKKMRAFGYNPVQYRLELEGTEIVMNELVGSEISFHFTGVINCTICGKKTKKSFSQGLCYSCFSNAPENAPCIIRPELCEGHLGKGRNPEWELKYHVQPHIVYLALTSKVKVGVTRKTQIPTRWINQGAWKAIILAETPNRYLAGKIEVALKEHRSDKTSWQKMLTNECNNDIDLEDEKDEVADLLPNEFQDYYSYDSEVLEIKYPVLEYPKKVKSLSFDKTPDIKEKLIGIRGQYLLFESGNVLSIKKHSGYLVELGD